MLKIPTDLPGNKGRVRISNNRICKLGQVNRIAYYKRLSRDIPANEIRKLMNCLRIRKDL